MKSKPYGVRKLIKMLGFGRFVRVSDWNMVCKIVPLIADGTIKIIHHERFDWKKNYPEMYDLDLKNIKTWSTYDRCVDLKFEMMGSSLHCQAIIYEGDNFTGNRGDKRFRVDLILPNSFVLEISTYIRSRFNSFLEDSYEEHLENQAQIWKSLLQAELIG